MKQCVRCGKRLKPEQKLRCGRCIVRVNEELEGKADRPYQYYFRFNIKRRKHENNELSKMLKKIEKRGARKYCLQCRKEVDDEIARAYVQKHLKNKKGE